MHLTKISFLLSALLLVGCWLNLVLAQEPQPAPPDSAELAEELARELGMEGQESGQTGQEGHISQETRQARRSFFQNMNPNLSVIGDVRATASSADILERNYELSFNEAEFAFQAAVDPYAKADFFIAFGKHAESPIHPEGDEHEEEEEGHGGLEPEIEEAYITILSLPFSTQLKGGKFRMRFGKINETHPHAYNFIDIPLMHSNFFGPEGLNDEGASLSWLLPHRAFFQELTFQVTSGPSENTSFMRAERNRLLYLAHLKNFFDLNDDTTLELGVTGVTGPHNEAGDATNMLGLDLTIKWKPLQRNRYKSIEFLNEFVISNRDEAAGDVNSLGFYSFLRYQLNRRWFLGAMFDYSEFPEFSELNHQAYSGILQFLISEFQKFEVQYKYNNPNFVDDFMELKLRAVFVIGAHGAHQY